jgi:citrate lyase gamma subunit
MTLGPEFSPLVQRYAGYIQQAKDIEEIGALLMVFEQRVQAAVQDACSACEWDNMTGAGE